METTPRHIGEAQCNSTHMTPPALPSNQFTPFLVQSTILRSMSGAMVPLEALSNELQDLYGRGSLELEVLQGHVLSDNAVRASSKLKVHRTM